MPSTASQLYIQMIQHAYEGKDGDFATLCESLFSASTLQTHRSKDTRINIDEINTLFTSISEELNDPLFALKIGESIHPSDYGILGHVWMNCDTLLDCFKLVVKFKQLMNDNFSAEYSIQNNEFIYNLSMPNLSKDEEKDFIDLDISSIFYMGKFLVGPRLKNQVFFKSVKLRHDHNIELKNKYEKILNCPVSMGEKENQIVLDMAAVNLPVHSPDNSIQQIMLGKVKQLACNTVDNAPVRKKVSSYINKNMKGNLPTAEVTAKNIGLSLSSLKRALKAEDTSYQQLIDEVRYRQATSMLIEQQYSACEISFLLGYSNASSFSRAFKTRTGLTPKEFRTQQHIA